MSRRYEGLLSRLDAAGSAEACDGELVQPLLCEAADALAALLKERPELPWRPASEVPPAAPHNPAMSLSLPVRLDDGTTAMGYQHNGKWWLDDKVVGTVTHWLPLEALAGALPDDAVTDEDLRAYDELIESIHEALGQDVGDSDALIVPAIKALRAQPDLAPLKAAWDRLQNGEPGEDWQRDRAAVLRAVGLLFEAQSGEAVHATTPEALPLPERIQRLYLPPVPALPLPRAPAGLYQPVVDAARAVALHLLAPLRTLVPKGDALEETHLVAAVASRCTIQQTQIEQVGQVLDEAGVPEAAFPGHPNALAARVRNLHGRNVNAGVIAKERDLLRTTVTELQTARDEARGEAERERVRSRADELAWRKVRDEANAEAEAARAALEAERRLVAQIQAERYRVSSQAGQLREERNRLTALVEQIRAVAFSPYGAPGDWYGRVKEIQRLLGQDGVEAVGVKAAPIQPAPEGIWAGCEEKVPADVAIAATAAQDSDGDEPR